MHHLLRHLLIATILLNAAAFAEESGLPAKVRLQNDQEAISGRYSRFERLLSQMADILRHEDPERAELLRRAISKGHEQEISTGLDEIADMLGGGNFGAALEKQKNIEGSLLLMLKLLQSEDRRSAVEKERERLNNILKGIRNTITQERAARGNALNSKAPSSAAPAQQKAIKSADGLLDDIKEHDERNQPSDEESGGEGESPSGKDGDPSGDEKSGEPNGKEQGDSQSGKSGDSDGESEKSESEKGGSESGESGEKDSKKGEPSEQSGEPKEGGGERPENGSDEPSSQSDSEDQESSEQSSGGSQQSQDSQPKKSGGKQSQGGSQNKQQDEEEQEQTPGRQNLEQARNLMQEALEQLQKQERDNAVDKQDAALAELQKAERELEEQLRQLREEEKEMLLAALEARFQRLLALQIQINESTVDLAAAPREKWLDTVVSRCKEVSQQQADVTRECSQTTSLLREDGTSVSILVSMEDIEADMGTVSDRLRDTKVFALTQSIQSDIVEALEELIKATQQEMEEMKEKQQQQQQQQQDGQQEKPPLVELMAEIKVLRSLQMRVNRRTRQVDDLLEQSDPGDVDDLNAQLQELSLRQQRLRESAAELAERMER